MARVTDLACAHSDLVNAKQVLRMAEIIDEEGHWIAGNDTLVQTGDMVDRGQYRHMERCRILISPLSLLSIRYGHHCALPHVPKSARGSSCSWGRALLHLGKWVYK
jgi:hypothetical protein